MQNLVFNQENKVLTNSRLIALKFGKAHKNILRDIKNLECSDEFSRLNFEPSTYKNSRGKEYEEYVITKDGFVFLVMGFTGKNAAKFKEDYIQAFNKMETHIQQIEASKAPVIPQTFSQALRLAADEAEQKELALKKLDASQRKLAIAAPKADLADRLTKINKLLTVSEAAKLLKLPYGRNIFFRKLREEGIFFKNKNEPKQNYVQSGYFELKSKLVDRNNHDPFIIIQVFVTPKGLKFLHKRFCQPAESK